MQRGVLELLLGFQSTCLVCESFAAQALDGSRPPILQVSFTKESNASHVSIILRKNWQDPCTKREDDKGDLSLVQRLLKLPFGVNLLSRFFSDAAFVTCTMHFANLIAQIVRK